MKHIFIMFLIITGIHQLPAQKIRVEARDGKAVIVRTETDGTQVRETSEWVANPRDVLNAELDDATKYLEWVDGKIKKLQADKKAKQQEQKDLKKAISDLDAGLIIETGIPGDNKAAKKPKPTRKKPDRKE